MKKPNLKTYTIVVQVDLNNLAEKYYPMLLDMAKMIPKKPKKKLTKKTVYELLDSVPALHLFNLNLVLAENIPARGTVEYKDYLTMYSQLILSYLEKQGKV